MSPMAASIVARSKWTTIVMMIVASAALLAAREASAVAEQARPTGDPEWVQSWLTIPGQEAQLAVVDDLDGKAVFQGDIMLGEIGAAERTCPPGQYCARGLVNIPSFKGGVRHWPGGIIPFTCSQSAPCDLVEQAIEHWQARTGYRFVWRTTEAAWVNFSDDDLKHGCWSSVGMVGGGAQTIQVARRCGRGGVIHEIAHAIGFWHEQSRSDRDEFVQVLMENVIPDKRHNFAIVNTPTALPFGPYDYGSIMHYGARDFGIDDDGDGGPQPPRVTIVAPVGIGQRNGLSAGDVSAAEALRRKPPPPVKQCFNLSGHRGVGVMQSPRVDGAWLVASNGAVHTVGDATSYGSMHGKKLNAPVVGMAAKPTGKGYWLVASDGGIFSFGDAKFHGSTGNKKLNKPVVGMAATPSGNGYWLVASDGGIFSFGDAKFRGSTGNKKLNAPVVGMAVTRTGDGYWLVASDGGIFTFGDAKFYGSTGDKKLNARIVGMAATPSGKGYWLVASDGGIFSFGDARFAGSLVGEGATVVGMARDGVSAYWLASRSGCVYHKPR